MLNKVGTEAQSPVVAIVGGSKLSEKLLALKGLLGIVDHIIIGGSMSHTLLKST